MNKVILLSVLLTAVAIVAKAQEVSYGSGCSAIAAIIKRTSLESTWKDGQGKTNQIYDINVTSTGVCAAVAIGVIISVPDNSLIISTWNLESTATSDLVSGFGSELAVGDSSMSAGFILQSNNDTFPNPTIVVYGVNCYQACLNSSSSSTPTSSPSNSTSSGSNSTSSNSSASSDSSSSNSASESQSSSSESESSSSESSSSSPCPGRAESFFAISFSSYNGTWGIASDSGGASAAYAYALEGCSNYGQGGIIGCEPVVIAQSQCVALAATGDTHDKYPVENYLSGVGVSLIKSAAEALALANCRCISSGFPGAKCSILASACPTY